MHHYLRQHQHLDLLGHIRVHHLRRLPTFETWLFALLPELPKYKQLDLHRRR
jgi:hypothetical protein